ncbi:RagB/SusD family nutrient uptake outer membrane protein [Dyadobacter sp. CY312]|uniref:RagB/SusD family nutrient uptake outer membrane protein n=1 Tax=Dyadobacter sp. CY312 TaxID=2907303 RepID=UPI001F1F61F2|nr:RagB/SusD family nutrient uptake outer membrane protein [Dyadobacter sp. CY312]MCE7042797.1 RagB/SusD family nutrient uptake outer membrane protein [Dyadobacter sp. CY312]
MTRYRYSLLFATALLLSGCDKDFLDRNPQDAYSNSSLWSSSNDALAALNGCYSGWEESYNTLYMDCASDNAYGQYYWEGYTYFGNGSITPSSAYSQDRWSYSTIQKCNWFLENIDVTPMDEALKSRLKSEARFLRAYQYYTMSQLYGDIPLVTKSISGEEANAISKTPMIEVQAFILSELGAVAATLPVNYTGSDVGRVTQGAALALKARIELYTGKYADAIASAQKVMALGYALHPSYQDLFRIQNENNKEVILDIQHKENDYANGNIGVMPSSSYGGWSSINPTQALVDAYETKDGRLITDAASGYNANDPYANRDPRLKATVLVPGQLYAGSYFNPIESSSADFIGGGNNSATGYIVNKYTSNLSDYPDMWNTGLNQIVIRYAEVLLIYAEAKIEAGQVDASVYDAIDAVRVRAGMPKTDRVVYNSQVKLRELVRRERRVELAMEGLRWFDVQRWKIGPEVMAKPVLGARLGKVDLATGKLTLSGEHIKAEDRTFDPAKNYVWPIPQSEIDINKNLGQNPNY